MRKAVVILLLTFYVSSSESASDPWGVYGEVCYVGQTPQYDPSRAGLVPTFVINLDTAPEERWRAVAEIYQTQVLAALHTVRDVVDFVVPGVYEYLVELCEKSIDNVAEPYRSEIKGFTNISQVRLGEVALLNMFYEIAKGCTSIVAQTPQGKIYHARNQDFGTGFIWNMTQHTWGQTIALKDLVINVDYMKGGQLFYKGVTFAGHMGVLTGLRPHGFTLSTNARFGSTRANMIDFFVRGITGREWILYMDRDVLENSAKFSEAVDFLSNHPMLASGYFILGGTLPGEGAIITRGPNGTDHLQMLQPNAKDGWYLLQTNYDWDKKEIYLDSRLGPGNDCMHRLGQANVGLSGLYQVLSSKPNLNKATVYTSVMQVDDNGGILESYIRHCDDPCWFV